MIYFIQVMNVLRLISVTRSYSEKWQKEELLRAAWLLTTTVLSGLWEGEKRYFVSKIVLTYCEKKCFQILILLRSTFFEKI
jgi:hypothetical protein